MILSFHPCFEADKNIICAGRNPDADDLAAIKAADAVILPQGCKETFYQISRNNCANVFPNFDARFQYPGKIGQIRLFQETDVPHPKSFTYHAVKSFSGHHRRLPERPPFSFPFVFKFDWGGEGDNVYLIKTFAELQDVLQRTKNFERTGQAGFLIQEYIPSSNRSLRVVVVGQQVFSYWRIHKSKSTKSFYSSLAKGAVIDADSDPDMQEAAVALVKDFCKKTGVNLAGFDVIFSSETKTKDPLLLEINYFFGRQGLGGSERFYELLTTEIKRWIDTLSLN